MGADLAASVDLESPDSGNRTGAQLGTSGMRFPMTLPLSLALAPVVVAQCDPVEVKSPESLGYDWFGMGVAAAGDLLCVGAVGADGPVANSGAAYLYEHQGGSWGLVTKLVDAGQSEPSDFGASAAFLGTDQLFVGDWTDSSAGPDGHGSVLVFEDTGSGWSEKAKLLPSDLPAYAEFGRTLACDGDWLVVGATGWNGNQGAAYFFEQVGGVWVERQIESPAPGPIYQGAIEVDLVGDLAVVTVLRESELFGWGMLHVYELSAGVWTHVQNLEAPYQRGSDWVHGQSVRILDGRIVAGTAQGYVAPADLALVWEKDDAGFEPVAELRPHLADPAYRFGLHVAGAGTQLALTSEDRLHRFERVDGTWLRRHDLDLGLDLYAAGGWFLGSLVATSQRTVIAQPFWNGNRGRVLVIEDDPLVTPFCPGTTCPCGNHSVGEGCAHSGGGGGWIEACGSSSVSLDELTLTARGLPTNQFGILFMGAGEQSAVLGDGRLCVAPGGAGLFRYVPAQHSGSDGSITIGPGLVAQSQSFELAGRIQPGQTWAFQAWCRDPSGPCGSGSSVSSAVRVTFVP